jgi:hypothetical protein
MEEGEKARLIRYIALDIHKYYSVLAGVAKHCQEKKKQPRKGTLPQLFSC